MVGIVVNRWILHQLSDGPSTAIHAIQDRIEPVDGVSQLGGELGIFGDHAQASFAGIDVGEELVGVGYGLVQVVGQRLILEQLADRSLALVEIGGDFVQLRTVSLIWL